MKNILTQAQIDEIKQLCEEYKISNYKINNDGTIDVDGNVYLENKQLTSFPLKFNYVSGWFDCSVNYLTSLEGSPKRIDGHLLCYDNKLSTLHHFPPLSDHQGGSFISSKNKFPDMVVEKLITPLIGDTGVAVFNVFLKYQDHFDVWTGPYGFNEEGFNDLLTEIQDGLL